MFDERIFEKQGIEFGMDDGEFEPTNLLDELARFGIMLEQVGEITTDSVFKVFGFTYIDNGIGRIEIAVNTGFFR